MPNQFKSSRNRPYQHSQCFDLFPRLLVPAKTETAIAPRNFDNTETLYIMNSVVR